MGADYFAIVDCPLQRRLTPEGFCQRLKIHVQLVGLEARRAEIEQAAGMPLEQITLNRGGTNNPRRELTYREMRATADEVAGGIPECASCPVSGGHSLGCYRYVTYPIDAVCEELLLDYFVHMLDHPRPEDLVGRDPSGKQFTAADLLFDLVIARLPEHTPWHVQRASLTERAEPVSRQLKVRQCVLDSAQVLNAAFTRIDGPPALQLVAHFFVGFCRWAAEQPGTVASRTYLEIGRLSELLADASKQLKRGPVDVVVDS